MLRLSGSLLCGSLMMLFVAQAADNGGKTDGARQVTFSKDVAPIFQKSCQSCHHQGTSAPMSLMTYSETRPWARSIKEHVVRRDMPPWHLDKTVGIRQYKNDRSLSDDEIATIARWVDNGAPQGNPTDMPPSPAFTSDKQGLIANPVLPAPPNEHLTLYP